MRVRDLRRRPGAGIEIRAGLHLGEAEVLEHKVGGIAVNVGARVMGVAKGGEVLVSSTLRDAVAGSGFAFADHGTHRLKGIEGEWRLYEVTMVEGERRSLPLSAEEARTRREFGEALPVRRTRDRILAGAAGALVVALVAAGILTNALGGEEPDAAGREGLTDAERSLLALVPEGFRSNCSSSTSPPPNATASVDCIPTEMYSVRTRATEPRSTSAPRSKDSRRPPISRTSTALVIHRRDMTTPSTGLPPVRSPATWSKGPVSARPTR